VHPVSKGRKEADDYWPALVMAWWDARNKANAGEKLRFTEEVLFRARMINISTDMEIMGNAVSESVSQDKKWDPPSEGVWKVNIDGAFRVANKRGAWGFVMRDSEGKAAMAGLDASKSQQMLSVLKPIHVLRL